MINTQESFPLIEARSISKQYDFGGSRLFKFGNKTFRALDDVSLSVNAGEVLAVIGESGSGKSTLSRIMANLIQPTSGNVLFEGNSFANSRGEDRKSWHRKIQLIQQDTRGSLDPRMSVFAQIEEPLIIHRIGTKVERQERVRSLIEKVGLPQKIGEQLPHTISGGQRQRVVIARALALAPKVLICDEPVSSLDLTIQVQIVKLLLQIKRERNSALVFVTHDLPLAGKIADRMVVLYKGRLVESGTADEVLYSPKHNYTKALVASTFAISGSNSLNEKERVLAVYSA